MEYQPYWAARAELLSRADQKAAAGAAYQRAIGLASDDAVRTFLQIRLDRLGV
jgi:RNA polymerase sigma-70 factor, ECF subfamily